MQCPPHQVWIEYCFTLSLWRLTRLASHRTPYRSLLHALRVRPSTAAASTRLPSRHLLHIWCLSSHGGHRVRSRPDVVARLLPLLCRLVGVRLARCWGDWVSAASMDPNPQLARIPTRSQHGSQPAASMDPNPQHGSQPAASTDSNPQHGSQPRHVHRGYHRSASDISRGGTLRSRGGVCLSASCAACAAVAWAL